MFKKWTLVPHHQLTDRFNYDKKSHKKYTGCETLTANYIGLLFPIKFAFRVSHPVLEDFGNYYHGTDLMET